MNQIPWPLDPPTPRIFLSYRRQDAEGHAWRLFDYLAHIFGPNETFIDQSNIPAGKDFVKVITRVLDSARVLLVVIGPSWGSFFRSAEKREGDNHDHVLLEIEEAQRLGIDIVPVFVGGAKMPAGDHLPEAIRLAASINGISLDHRQFASDVDRLAQVVERSLRASPRRAFGRLSRLRMWDRDLPVKLISAGIDLGIAETGARLGPGLFAIAGLENSLRRIGLDVGWHQTLQVPLSGSSRPGYAGARYQDEIVAVSLKLAKIVEETLDDGAFPVVIGGDACTGLGTAIGFRSHAAPIGDLATIWYDHAARLSTPDTSPTGSISAMVRSVLLGHGKLLDVPGSELEYLAPDAMSLIGLSPRSLDSAEVALLQQSGVKAYPQDDIELQGEEVFSSVIEHAMAGTSSQCHLGVNLGTLGDPTTRVGSVRFERYVAQLSALFDSLLGTGRLRCLELYFDDQRQPLAAREEQVAAVINILAS